MPTKAPRGWTWRHCWWWERIPRYKQNTPRTPALPSLQPHQKALMWAFVIGAIYSPLVCSIVRLR